MRGMVAIPSPSVAESLPSIDPATGKILKTFEKTSPQSVPALLGKTRVAQAEWAKWPLEKRCAQLKVLRAKMLEAREELTDAVVRESGKPRTEAKFADVFVSLDSADYFMKNASKMLAPESVPHHSLAAKAKTGRLVYEPLGVVAIISSWNYPLAIPMSQIIAAVVAGNGVMCKASDFTPECGEWIGRLFREAGFPADLVTILQGGGDVGQALIEARPDKVFFTGSVFTGRHVAEACAPLLIPSVLELGGKDAMLVLGDADLEMASSAAVWGSYSNCGQVCLSVERLFVEEAVSEAFIAKCVEKTKKLRLGRGSDPNTEIGPMIRPQHVQRMSELLADAVQQGARVVCGGRPRPDLGPNFFEPTVIVGVESSMKLFQDETFGPIMAIQMVKDAREALRRANDSEFALSASIWTNDLEGGQRMARELRVGVVMVNDLISGFAIAEAPHGGCGLSGWGRTHGKAGFQEMVHVKYIDVDRMPWIEKPWWYRYGADVERAADAFLEFSFADGIVRRLRNAWEATKTALRDHGMK